MSAFLKKLFKPKWKSQSATTRKAYISELNPSKDEDKSILIKLARNDTDNQVRRAAINQIDSISTLLELYKEQSAPLKPAITDRLQALAQSNKLPIYELITDEGLLTELIINADSPTQYQGALPKLSPKSLETIATTAKINQLRQSATELVEDEGQLTSIEKQAKNKDKRVYQLAKTKLKAIKESRKQSLELINKKEALVKSLEDHAVSETVKLYDAKLSALLDAWHELGQETTDELQQRFETSKAACQVKAKTFKTQQEDSERAEQLTQQQTEERQATIETLEQTASRFKETAIDSAGELSALDAIIKTQETRWLEATRNASVEKSEQKRYQQYMNELKRFLNASQHFITHQGKFADLLSNETTEVEVKTTQQLKEIQAFIKEIDWPSSFATPLVLKQLAKLAGHIVDQRKQHAQDSSKLKKQIEEQLNALEKNLNDKALKPSSRLFKELNHQLHNIDRHLSSQYTGRLQLLGKQLDELRDWQGFAVSPKQTELCEHMELLAEQHLAPTIKAEKIKELQDEWKRLGGSSDQKVWQRFKQACDKAFIPCQNYFEEQRSLKKSNLDKRKVICQQLDDFIQQNDWSHADWKAVEMINRKAREEWKACYPVEFKENKSVQHRFNGLLSKIDDYLDQERSKNKQLKQAIVERTQQLVAHEPLSEAIEGAKQLQSEWQQIGITLHKDDRALWKEYRAACDQIFQRRDEARETRKHAIDEAIAVADALCVEVVACKSDVEAVTTKQLTEFKQRLKEIPALPKKELEQLSRQLDQHINDIKAAQAEKSVKNEQLRWSELERKSLFIRDIAESVAKGEEAIDFDSAATELNFGDRQHPIEKILHQLWVDLTNGKSLEPCTVTAEQAKSLCIQCEIAAELDSPAEDQEIRMQLQVSRLSKGLSSNIDKESKRDELESYLVDWFGICLLPSSIRKDLEARINKVLAQIAQSNLA